MLPTQPVLPLCWEQRPGKQQPLQHFSCTRYVSEYWPPPSQLSSQGFLSHREEKPTVLSLSGASHTNSPWRLTSLTSSKHNTAFFYWTLRPVIEDQEVAVGLPDHSSFTKLSVVAWDSWYLPSRRQASCWWHLPFHLPWWPVESAEQQQGLSLPWDTCGGLICSEADFHNLGFCWHCAALHASSTILSCWSLPFVWH